MGKTLDYPIYGHPVDEGAVEQMETCTAPGTGAVAAALMADHHLGYSLPIGGVVAYEGKVSPSGVGYDIACGNKAVRLDIGGDELRKWREETMDAIVEDIAFGIGKVNLHASAADFFATLADDPAWELPACREHRQLAQDQLGTMGSGNHFVDLFTDESDRVWVGVHLGSRGFGHKLATHYVKAGGGKDGMHTPPVLLADDSDLGQEYIAAMQLAGRYAYAGRDWVCHRVAELLGAYIKEEVHNHHNFAWEEEHGGRKVWVVRKGATPAWPGQQGFVGGSMGDLSFIIEGVESPASQAALYSTIHGAGRAMSRTEAGGKWKWKKDPEGGRKLTKVRDGCITALMRDEYLGRQLVPITRRGGGLDEAPQAYKRIEQVLAHHVDTGTICVLQTLTPVGVAMAGGDGEGE